jgi:hypothetical protein
MEHIAAVVIGFAVGFVVAEVAYRYLGWGIPAK